MSRGEVPEHFLAISEADDVFDFRLVEFGEDESSGDVLNLDSATGRDLLIPILLFLLILVESGD